MKTIEEFIKEIEGSAALQDELKAVRDKDALTAFLKKNDVDETIEDFIKAVKAKAEAEGEITDDDAEAVAGGFFGLSDEEFFLMYAIAHSPSFKAEHPDVEERYLTQLALEEIRKNNYLS